METHEIQKNADSTDTTNDDFLFLRQADRQFRYFAYDRKREKIIIDGETVTFVPSREDSLDRLIEKGVVFASDERSVEDQVVAGIERQQLSAALNKLDLDERRLIDEIFFSQDGEGKSEREAAKSLGIPQRTLNDHKHRVLEKLKKYLEKRK